MGTHKLKKQGRSHQNLGQVAKESQKHSSDCLKGESLNQLVQASSDSHCSWLAFSGEGCLYAGVAVFGLGFLCDETNDLWVMSLPRLFRGYSYLVKLSLTEVTTSDKSKLFEVWGCYGARQEDMSKMQ